MHFRTSAMGDVDGMNNCSPSESVGCWGDAPKRITRLSDILMDIKMEQNLSNRASHTDTRNESCHVEHVSPQVTKESKNDASTSKKQHFPLATGNECSTKETKSSKAPTSNRKRLLEWLQTSQAKRDENNRQVFSRWIDRIDSLHAQEALANQNFPANLGSAVANGTSVGSNDLTTFSSNGLFTTVPTFPGLVAQQPTLLLGNPYIANPNNIPQNKTALTASCPHNVHPTYSSEPYTTISLLPNTGKPASDAGNQPNGVVYPDINYSSNCSYRGIEASKCDLIATDVTADTYDQDVLEKSVKPLSIPTATVYYNQQLPLKEDTPIQSIDFNNESPTMLANASDISERNAFPSIGNQILPLPQHQQPYYHTMANFGDIYPQYFQYYYYPNQSATPFHLPNPNIYPEQQTNSKMIGLNQPVVYIMPAHLSAGVQNASQLSSSMPPVYLTNGCIYVPPISNLVEPLLPGQNDANGAGSDGSDQLPSSLCSDMSELSMNDVNQLDTKAEQVNMGNSFGELHENEAAFNLNNWFTMVDDKIVRSSTVENEAI